MADKKVDRSHPGRSLTPTQKLESAISDPGTINMAQPAHDKGKSALLDKFRRREERWRLEQALQDQEKGQSPESHRAEQVQKEEQPSDAPNRAKGSKR